MTNSLRALLAGVIDYAGLFPPAALPFDQAIRNYGRYLAEPESWMLGRFICPAGRLPELAPFVGAYTSAAPLRLAVLLGKEPERETLEALQFEARQTGRARIDGFETPAASFPFPWQRSLFIERPLGDHRPAGPGVGLKFRLGGLEAAAFPSVTQVASAIAHGLAAGCIKFTAGLHHPIRRHDPGLQVKMHGFINVFVAGVLARVLKLGEAEIGPIIEEEKAEHFRFDDQRLHWRGLSATVDEITAARRFVTSFGSCSFDEPRDDLRALGWL